MGSSNRKDRGVVDRLKSLESVPPVANFTLAGVRIMYEGGGGEEFHCTISGYCRTQIFDFPGIDFHPDGDEPHHMIYSSSSVQANLVSSLVDYFEESTFSNHYTISPSLRYEVSETNEKIKSQQKNRVPVFLVIEELNQLDPVEMKKGECSTLDEVALQDDKMVPFLVGGREREKFIIAWHTTGGAWPDLPNNEQWVNMILAGVRVGQQVTDPIRKHLDQSCLVTDDGRFVVMMRPTMSARGSVATSMDSTAYREKVDEISKGIAALEQVIGAPHMVLLFNSMYRDDYMDDVYQRLHYLKLWQSLSEAGRKHLDYQGNIREDNVVVAGNKTLKELKDYRDSIAHWWVDSIDENFLADLQRTINELMRRKFI